MYNRHQELVRPSGRWMVKVRTMLILLPSITYHCHCQVRTLHIFGTADVAFTVKTAEDTGDWVEDYQLELVEGASHFVQEHEPEKVNKLIEKFIQ